MAENGDQGAGKPPSPQGDAQGNAQGDAQGNAQGDAQGADQGQGQDQELQMPDVQILAQFVRDLSFENVGVIQGTPAHGQPDISVSVNLDAGHMSEDNYRLNMKITAKAVTPEGTRFLVELDYGGVFLIQNAPESHIHPILFIECPRQLWPFARRVVADVTRDGGYPPLMLDNIDFAGLYRQKMAEMQGEPGQGGADEGQKPN